MPSIIERRTISLMPDEPSAEEMLLAPAQTLEELEAVRAFRMATYLSRSNLEVDDGVEVDQRSYVFGLWSGGGLRGCVRALPLPDPASGVAMVENPALADHGMQCEVGRMAVAARGSTRSFLSLVGLGSQWMLSFTDVRTFAAYCAPRLARLYEQVGAEDLGLETVHCANQRTYRVVTGRFDVVATRARALMGISSVTAAASLFQLRTPERISA